MTAKDYLNLIRLCDKRIEMLKEEREKITTRLTHITADPSKEAIQGGRTSGINEALIDRLIILDKRLALEQEQAVSLRESIIFEINSLDKPEHVEVLKLRYLDCLEWKEIKNISHYEESTLYGHHGRALKEFAHKYRSKLELL